MSYPILYSATETNFDHNGIGILSACVSCEVTEEANGIFELAMTYPMDGVHYSQISDRCLIKAKPNNEAEPQLFRVYSIKKTMSGVAIVYAKHISYDLSGIPVSVFTADNAPSAMMGLAQNAVVDCPFVFMTDKTTVANFSVRYPGSIRSKLGGSSGSILDVYGGEYEFDNYNVILHRQRGRNRGVSIRYGKNLTDIQQDRNCGSVVTGVYPYWFDSESEKVIELPEKIVNVDGTYDFSKIKMLALSDDFTYKPTEDEIRSHTKSYIKNNNVGVPDVSLSVSFRQLEQTEEYKGLALLEKVSLFDTVSVEFPALGVSATAKAVKIIYNVIMDRVESVTLGSVKSNIADTLANQQQQIEQAPSKNYVQSVANAASAVSTAWLTNGKGYKVERRDANGNTVDTLYMDTPDINTAVNVLRIGQSGIGFSNNGVNGPYYSAWTLDGRFNADFIQAGSIKSKDGKSVVIDLDKGEGTFTGSFKTMEVNNSEWESSFDVASMSPTGVFAEVVSKITGEDLSGARLTPSAISVYMGTGHTKMLPPAPGDWEGEAGFVHEREGLGRVSLGTHPPYAVDIDESYDNKAYLILENYVVGKKLEIAINQWFSNAYRSYITGLTAPVDASDAVNKEYADDIKNNALPGKETPTHAGCYYRNVGANIDWINPGMTIGTEYRTTERWDGSVVYTKLLEGFALPNTDSMTVTISGAKGIKSIDGYITNGKYDIPIWAANAAISNMYFTKSSGVLNLTTNADRSTWTCYLTVKYIK